MDAVDRDLEMVEVERKMADDKRRWRTYIDDHCGDYIMTGQLEEKKKIGLVHVALLPSFRRHGFSQY